MPLYLSHRYQVEAAVKSVGGLDYRYAARGDGQLVTQILDPAEQRRALDAVLKTISPEALTLPERIIRQIPPRPAGIPETRELFRGRTGLTFDPVGAAESAADGVLELLTNPQRATRLVEYHARDPNRHRLTKCSTASSLRRGRPRPPPDLPREVQRAVQLVALRRVMSLAADESASGAARAIAMAKYLGSSPSLRRHPQRIRRIADQRLREGPEGDATAESRLNRRPACRSAQRVRLRLAQ